MSPKQTGDVDDDVSPNASLPVPPYCVPPHPANEAYVKCMADVLMKTIGMNLSSVTTSENFAWPAIKIREYFSDHFDEQIEASVIPNVPKFLLPPEQRVTPVIVPAAFRYRLGSLELTNPDQVCAVVRNLDWLTEAFHLSSTERKVLLWTYVVNSQMPSFIEGVMSEIQFCNEHQAHAALSLLFEEPESEVAKCFAAPSRLRGMRIIDSCQQRLNIDTVLSCQRFNTDTPNVFHLCPGGLVQEGRSPTVTRPLRRRFIRSRSFVQHVPSLLGAGA